MRPDPAIWMTTFWATPSLAIEALNRELGRVSRHCARMAREAISAEATDQSRLQAQAEGIYQLVGRINAFNQELARQNLNPEISETLPISLRVARYFSEIARLSAQLPEHYSLFENIADEGLRRQLFDFQQLLIQLIDGTEISEDSNTQGYESHRMMHQVHKRYQALKAQVLEQTVRGRLSAEESMQLLDAISHLQRLAEQAEKASIHWSSTLPILHRSPLNEEPGSE